MMFWAPNRNYSKSETYLTFRAPNRKTEIILRQKPISLLGLPTEIILSQKG